MRAAIFIRPAHHRGVEVAAAAELIPGKAESAADGGTYLPHAILCVALF